MQQRMVRATINYASSSIFIVLILGFRATLGTLDSATEHVPKDGPVFIVTASFEGQPADNAVHFVEWLSSLSGSELAGTKFGVFGCGNHDWTTTYQRIPKLIDQLFEERGATRLVERGEGDAGGSDFFDTFDAWEANLWPVLSKVTDKCCPGLSVVLNLPSCTGI